MGHLGQYYTWQFITGRTGAVYCKTRLAIVGLKETGQDGANKGKAVRDGTAGATWSTSDSSGVG